MSVISHDSGLPSFLGVSPRFSFFDQAVIEQPAPIKYEIAQKYRQFIQRDFGPDFHYEIAKRAHEVWLTKRPWWLGVV